MISPPACSNAWPGERVVGEDGAEREPEQVAGALVPLEVVALPVRAVEGHVTIDQAVLAGDPAGGEPGPRQLVVEEVGLDVDLEQAFQRPRLLRQVEQGVVQRRPRGGGDEPVGPHGGHRAARQRVDLRGQGAGRLVAVLVVLQAVGVATQDLVAELTLIPAHVAEVDGEDGLRGVDRLGDDDLGLPAQAVDQLGDGGAGEPQVVIAEAPVVVQVVEREVAQEGAVALAHVGAGGRGWRPARPSRS